MCDSTLNRLCVDCGSDILTNPHEPGRCAPCDESLARRILRRICALCRGRCDLREKMCFQDGRVVDVLRVCPDCGGTGELIWPR